MNFKSLLFLGVGTTLTKDFLVKYVNESPSIEKVVTIISDKNQEIIFNRPIDLIELDFLKINKGKYPRDIIEKIPIDQEIFSLLDGKIIDCLKMMDRAEQYIFFDSGNRFELLLNHLEFWYSLLKQKEIDLIISSDMPHETQDYIAYSLGEIFEIKRCFISQSSIHQFYQILKDIDVNDDRLKNYKVLNFPDDRIVNPIIEEYFKSQLDENYIPFYMKENSSAVPHTHRKVTFKIYFNKVLNRINYFFENKLFLVNNMINFLYKRNNYGSVADKKIIKFYNKNTINPDFSKKYIYIPLHFQPERTTCPQGKLFVFQEIMIKMISEAIPDDWVIYVKEHPWQMSRGRRIAFYKNILELKNINFVSRQTKSSSLIINSKAVSVICGTSGWESIFYKKPVLVFGNIFFKYLDGAFEIKTNKELKKALEKIISDKIILDNNNLIQFLNCCDRYFFQGAIDGHYFDNCELDWDTNLNLLCKNINKFISQSD